MDINCTNSVEKYLLNKNPLYAFSFPIALIVGIFFFGISKAYNWSDNDYVNQILIPIVAVLLTMVLIDFISRAMITKEEKMHMIDKCELWKKKKKNIETFSSGNFTIQDNEIHNNLKSTDNTSIIKEKAMNSMIEKNDFHVEIPISQIPTFEPSPYESLKINDKCTDGKTCFQLCSGVDKKPENMVAPIPGPTWLPKSAETVQNDLKNNIYSIGSC